MWCGRQGVRLPGELQRSQGQAHQTQATAALHLGYRPGQEQEQPCEQQRTAQRHKGEVNRGPQQAACQQTGRHTPQWAFTQRCYEGIGLLPEVAQLTTSAVPGALEHKDNASPLPQGVLPYGGRG